MSMHYCVKRRCSKLSQNAVGLIISVRLLTFASSIRQNAPHDLVFYGLILNGLNILQLKGYTADRFLREFRTKNWTRAQILRILK